MFKVKKLEARLIIIYLIICFILNLLVTINSHKRDIITDPTELSLIAISIAITEIGTNKNNYVGNQNVLSALKNSSEYKSYSECKKIKQNCRLTGLDFSAPSTLASSETNFKKLYYETEHIGLIDFYKLAMLLFGNEISSFTFLYFTILGVSVLIFFINFKQNIPALIMLATFLTCHLIFVFYLPSFIVKFGNFTHDFGAIYNRRFLSVLTLIPSIHILITIFNKKLMQNSEIFYVVIQLFLIFLIIHFRSSANYQFIFLFGCCLFKIINERFHYKFYLSLKVPSTLIIFTLIGLASSFHIKKTINMDPIYSVKRTSHLFWHPAYIGLSAHPLSNEKYKIYFGDSASFEYIEKVSLNEHNSPYWQTFYSYDDFDRLLKEKVFEIAKTDTYFFIESYVYKLQKFGKIILDEFIVKRPHSILIVFIFSMFVSFLFKNKLNTRFHLRAHFYLAFCSAIPAFFLLPQLLYIIDSIIILLMILSYLFIKIISLINFNFLIKKS